MYVQLVYRDAYHDFIRAYPQPLEIGFGGVVPSKKMVERLVIDAHALKKSQNLDILGFVIVESPISKHGSEEIQRFDSFLSKRRINELMG